MEHFPGISRSRARAEIMSGRVLVEGQVCSKPGLLYPRDAEILLLEPRRRYVSRGGFKLAGALDDLGLTVEGFTVLDVGASTGGFTDCLLQHGARRVIALDVGYGQLDWALRRHPQVTVLERYNIRHLRPQDLPVAPDLAVVDLSFISLKLVLPVLKENRLPAILALVKPQFEVGRSEASRGGGLSAIPGCIAPCCANWSPLPVRPATAPRTSATRIFPGPRAISSILFTGSCAAGNAPAGESWKKRSQGWSAGPGKIW